MLAAPCLLESGSRGGARSSTAPEVLRVTASDRHRAAVASSLGWARESAERGDYCDALGWLAAVEASGDTLSADFEARRARWRTALRCSGPGGT